MDPLTKQKLLKSEVRAAHSTDNRQGYKYGCTRGRKAEIIQKSSDLNKKNRTPIGTDKGNHFSC